jgi:hypothetical protein
MPIINEINEVLHKIEARLYPNYLGKGEGAYVARAKAEAPLTIEDVCAAAKNRGGFNGSYEELVEHSYIFVNEVVYQLLDGFSVQMGRLFSLHSGITGTYNGPGDSISAENLHIAFRVLSQLKELLLKVKIENEGLAPVGAYIDVIVDVHTDSLNNALTPAGSIHITGDKIKIDGEGAEVGVWFVNTTGGARTKVTEHFAINRPTEIVATIPTLAPGQYKLELVTNYTHGKAGLKEPRVIQATPILTVS